MLKRIIIVAAIVLVPLAFYVASQYGELPKSTFQQAIAASTSQDESDPAGKVMITSSITGTSGDRLVCEDHTGQQFHVEYTGKPPATPFIAGQTIDFVGHVHGGEMPYFHATQAFPR